MKNSVGIFIGIGAAAVAGVILGALFTPAKGEDLRRNIKDAAGSWSKKLSNRFPEDKEQLKAKV